MVRIFWRLRLQTKRGLQRVIKTLKEETPWEIMESEFKLNLENLVLEEHQETRDLYIKLS
jgi:hypothetical protein